MKLVLCIRKEPYGDRLKVENMKRKKVGDDLMMSEIGTVWGYEKLLWRK